MFGVLRPSSPQQDRMPISPATSPQPPNSLAPMPPREYRTREELLAGTKDWAAQQGFAVVIARSRFNRLWLKCDRGGTYENRRNLTPDQRKRKRGDSRLLGCPFKMIATVKRDGIWRVETETPTHNHEPSDDLSAHPTLRRMTDEQLQKVHEMCDDGRSPAETIEALRSVWPDIKVLTRDIYNARKKYKTQKELAEAAAGGPQQHSFDDPNGVFPGPDENGRWAWVPDGEEVTSKKKRRRRTAPAATSSSSALDPQLHTPNQFTSAQPPISVPDQHSLQDDYHDSVDQPSFPQPNFGGPSSDDPAFRHAGPSQAQQQHHHQQPSLPDADSGTNFLQAAVAASRQYSQPPDRSPTRLRSQTASQRPSGPATATMIGTTTTAPAPAAAATIPALSDVGNNAGAGGGSGGQGAGAKPAQSGQVLMSRIERMESTLR